MFPKEGKNRVIIESVRPQVDNGRYPAKRTVGESVNVMANIFADGHDVLKARLRFKGPGESRWTDSPLSQTINDEWQGSFHVEKVGRYVFIVEAWVDHLATWYKGVVKKIEDGQHVNVELLEGALLLEKVQKTSGASRDFVKSAATLFRDEKSFERSVNHVLSDDFNDFIDKHALIENPSVNGNELEINVESKKALFSTWYELFPRSAAIKEGQHGTFKDVERLLPRVEAMGFDVLYLPPIHPIGQSHRKGKNNNVVAEEGEPGSPWAIGGVDGGHMSIHKELGTIDDYKSLIKKANSRGIDVALDLAYQCAPDHPYVDKHPQWFRWRPDGTVMYAENPPKKYQDILPLNFENDQWQELWTELKTVIEYWIEMGVKIFRVDNPHTKPIQFWEWVIAEINSSHPDVVFLAEAFTRPKIMASLAKSGFQQSYTYFTWRTSKQELMEYMNELINTESRDYFRPNFWPNTPDILPYHLQHAPENMFIIRYILAATLSSNYGLYGPVFEHYDNQPAGVREEYLNSEKYEIKVHDWNRVTRLTEIITIVNSIRNTHEALQSTWNLSFCDIQNDSLIPYIKKTDGLDDIILTVVTLDPNTIQSGYLRLPLEQLDVSGLINIRLTDLITGDTFTWTNEWNYIQVDPNQIPFRMFSVEVRESNS